MTTEHDLIARLFAPLCSPPDEAPAFGLSDDTALLSVNAGRELLMTSDALVADVHFFADDPLQKIAHKALAVNVSDIVAKGGLPADYLLTIAIPVGMDQEKLSLFAGGMKEAQEKYGCQLVGGDTVSTPGPLMISITMTGDVASGKMVRRKGAAPGDIVFVSGTIGDGALGLMARTQQLEKRGVKLTPEQHKHLINRYLLPQPDLTLAPLIARYASASMDISDGLVGDFAKLCAASNVGGLLHADKVPKSEAATVALAQMPELRETALTGGDDYEVLLCVPADKADELAKQGHRLTSIGVIGVPGEEVIVLGETGKPLDLPHGAYDHFSE